MSVREIFKQLYSIRRSPYKKVFQSASLFGLFYDFCTIIFLKIWIAFVTLQHICTQKPLWQSGRMGDEPLIARFHECFPLYTAVGLFKYGDIDSNHIFCRFQKLSLRKKRQWLNRQDAKYIKVHIKTCVTNDYGFRRLFAEYIRPYDPFCDAPKVTFHATAWYRYLACLSAMLQPGSIKLYPDAEQVYFLINDASESHKARQAGLSQIVQSYNLLRGNITSKEYTQKFQLLDGGQPTIRQIIRAYSLLSEDIGDTKYARKLQLRGIMACIFSFGWSLVYRNFLFRLQCCAKDRLINLLE